MEGFGGLSAAGMHPELLTGALTSGAFCNGPFPGAAEDDLYRQLAAARIGGPCPGRPLAPPAPGAGGGGSRGSKAPKKKDDDDSTYTTVMLRNIPNKYTRQMLIDQLHRAGFRGEVDYLYLPIDFANRCNCGYAFVNLRTTDGRRRFAAAFDGVAAQSCLPGFNSYKVCQVTKAKWQGREENVRRLRSGPELMAQLAAHPEWLPLLLDEGGNQELFLCEAPRETNPGGAGVQRRPPRKGGAGAGGMQGGFLGAFGVPPGAFSAGPMAFGGKGGKGAGGSKGGRGVGKGRRGGGGGQMFGYQDMMGAGGAFADPRMMQDMPVMPVRTEYGLQYLPYDAGNFEQSGFMYPPMMPYMPPYGMVAAAAQGWYGQQDYEAAYDGLGYDEDGVEGVGGSRLVDGEYDEEGEGF